MTQVPSSLKSRLRTLAQKYETKQFMTGDPSGIMHKFSGAREQETAAFITAQLSFGKRELFLAKVDEMLSDMKQSPTDWILSGAYKKFFPKKDEKFYRFFSYKDMNDLCARLAEILKQFPSLGEAVRVAYEAIEPKNELSLVTALIGRFEGVKCVAQDPRGACKKLHMFLRWMVRQNSPVDLGLWTWANARDLLIPLDVHVMQEGIRLGLLDAKASPSAKTAIALTQKMAQIWSDDPTKGDFALFGLGVDDEAQ